MAGSTAERALNGMVSSEVFGSSAFVPSSAVLFTEEDSFPRGGPHDWTRWSRFATNETRHVFLAP